MQENFTQNLEQINSYIEIMQENKAILKGIAPLEVASSGYLIYVDQKQYLKGLHDSKASWVLIRESDLKEVPDHIEAIVVENAPLGIQAGVTAGIYTIAVNTGPLPNTTLNEAGANYIFPSMQALSEQWDSFFQTTLTIKTELLQ